MKIKTLCIKTIPRKNINHNISKRDYKNIYTELVLKFVGV